MKKIYHGYLLLAPLIGIFLPEYLLAILGISAVLMIVVNLPLMKKILLYPQNMWIYIFNAYAIILALINNNQLGLIASMLVLLVSIWFSYLRLMMTKQIFNFMTYIIALGSLVSLYFTTTDYHQSISYRIISLFETNLKLQYTATMGDGMRLSSTFFNPNYYGYILIVVVLLCIWMALESFNQALKKPIHWLAVIFFAMIAIINFINFDLPQSRSMFLAFGVGLAAMLLMRSFKWLLGLIPMSGLIYYYWSDIVDFWPRMNEYLLGGNTRQSIWAIARAAILDSPLVGKGFYTYPLVYFNYGNYYQVHAHNLFLEIWLSFGLVGILILICFFIFSLWQPIKQWIDSQNHYLALIIGLIMLTLVHGFTDFVILCPQTALLFCVIYSSVSLKR